MSVAVWAINGVWWLAIITPLCSMKLSRLGICSRSDGTFGLSRVRWVLSNWIWTTCWILPLGDSRHPEGVAVAVVAVVAVGLAAAVADIASPPTRLMAAMAALPRPHRLVA